MKKLFLPTTSLNFSNILSSESISPKAFYIKRKFGYPRWFSIQEEPFDNSLLLYESLYDFEIPKSDFENHPLLIEINIEDADIEKLLKKTDGIFECTHTIYLNPWHTRFIFFSEQDKKITLSMSETSLETKLLSLYKKDIVVLEPPEKKYALIQSSETESLRLNEIEKDQRINKMKGLFYGYYIGAFLSSPIESVQILNVYYEIQNIFAAINSSLNKKATPNQNRRLDELFLIFIKKSSLYQKISAIEKNEEKTLQILNLIKQEFSIKNNIEDDKEYLLYNLTSNQLQSNTKNKSIEWIEKKIKQQKRAMYKDMHILSVDREEIVIVDNKLSVVTQIEDILDKKIFIAWVNDIFSSIEYNGKVSTFKEKLSDDITNKAKDVFGDEEKWKNSSQRSFLNSLRRHIRGEKLNHTWDNGLYSSVSAVISNGNDWQKLLKFMQNCGMNDYRLAFAIYGCLNGFANLTRDFTDIIFNHNNDIVSIYKEAYGQLLGKNINEIESPVKVAASKQNAKTPSIINDRSVKDDWKTNVRLFSKKISTKAKGFNAKIEEELYINSTLEGFLSNLPNRQPYKKIKIEFEQMPSKTIKLDLFGDKNPSKVFLNDYNYLVSNQEFINLVCHNKDWKKDLKWFIDVHNPNHVDYEKYYKDKPKDNESVIKQFIFLKEGRYKNTESFLCKTYLQNGK